MPKDFIFPDVGEGIHEGKIVKWHANIGDFVKADSTIVEVETDKAIVELPSPATGTVLKINHAVGETVKVGEVLVVIGSKDEILSSEQKLVTSPVVPISKSEPLSSLKPASSLPLDQVLATPSTRKLARDLGIDITKIKGTGPNGRIVPDDLKPTSSDVSQIQISQKIESPKIPMSLGSDQRIPLSGIRKVISDRMVYSKTHIPHACGMDFIDVTKLVQLRESEKKTLDEKGIKLTYLPFVIKSCALVLKKFPYLNSNFDESKNEIVLKSFVNIGIAVDTSDGLVVPVIKNADQKSVVQIAKEIESLASLSKERKLKLEDMKDGTFTITNIGSVGGFFSTPIINPPEVAILGVHRIKDMPLVIDGKVEARKVMGLSLCFDHRVIDGAMATHFINGVKEYLEDPNLMLLSMV